MSTRSSTAPITAAALSPAEPLALDAAATGWWTGAEVRKHFLAPGVALLLGVLSLAASPLAARWAEKGAQARVERVRPEQWASIDSARALLDRVTDVLAVTNRFAASRMHVTELLAGIARALPDSNVVTSFELDHGTAQAVVLTRQPATVLTATRALDGLTSAELMNGPPADASGAGGFQRVLLRFRLPGAGPSPSRGAK